MLLMLPICAVAQDEPQCTDFVEGTFVYKDTLQEFIIIRTGDEHSEINTDKKAVSVATVDWVKDCQYNLEFRSMPKGYKFMHGKTLKVFITDVFEDGYSYTSRIKGVVTKWTLVRYDGEIPDYSKWDGAE